MKNTLLVLLAFITFAGCSQTPSAKTDTADKFPAPRGYVSDFENILDKAMVDSLSKAIKLHENKTGNEIAVITTDNFGTYSDIDSYTLALSNHWGVGKKGVNNGITVVFSKKLKKVRISTGLGLESKLTDAQCQQIIDDIMIPQFKKEDYNTGILNGVNEIIRILE